MEVTRGRRKVKLARGKQQAESNGNPGARLRHGHATGRRVASFVTGRYSQHRDEGRAMKRTILVATALIATAGLGAACGSGDDDGGGGAAGSGGRGSGGLGTGGLGTGGLGTGGSGATPSGGSGTGGGSGSIIDCAGDYVGIPATCSEQLTQAELVPANVLMVLDKSGSMSGGKWEATMAAVNDALVELAPFANFGLILYPAASVTDDCYAQDRTTCCSVAATPEVPIGPGSTTATQIAEQLCGADGVCNSDDDPTGPAGWTPTAKALDSAHAYLTSFLQDSDPEVPTFVFLVTDGGPNCDEANSCDEAECTANIDNSMFAGANQCRDGDPNFPGPLQCLDVESDGDGPIAQVQALSALGVTTVVIGIPGSDQPQYVDILSQMAVAGGSPQTGATTDYFQVGEDQAAIKNVFIEVAAKLITSCDIDLATPPSSPDLAIVAVDCEVVEKTNASGVEQWTLEVTTDGAVLHLKDALCTRAQDEGLGSVDILYGCGIT
jgi:hypothetical protein